MAVLYTAYLESMPLVRLLPTVAFEWWWDHPTDPRREHGITSPVACAIAASKRSSCARRPSSRIAARTQTTAIVSDTPKDRVHGGQLSRGQTSAENSLARALGSPQRPPPAVANAHDDSPLQKAKFGPDPTMEALDITGA